MFRGIKTNDLFMAPMSCQEEKDMGKKTKGREKRKARSGIHLIKAGHGVTEGRESLTTLPQVLLINLTEAFI